MSFDNLSAGGTQDYRCDFGGTTGAGSNYNREMYYTMPTPHCAVSECGTPCHKTENIIPRGYPDEFTKIMCGYCKECKVECTFNFNYACGGKKFMSYVTDMFVNNFTKIMSKIFADQEDEDPIRP